MIVTAPRRPDIYVAARPSWGLGATVPQGITASAGAAAGGLQIASSSSVGGKVAGAGTVLLSLAPLSGPGAPFVAAAGAVVAVVGQIMNFLHVGDGCGQTCILTSQWADQAEALLKQNMQAYFSAPAPRLSGSKAAALAAFDAIWNQLKQACSAAQLKQAGINCIADRQAGACKWKQVAGADSLQYPGEPQPGQCWNWFSGYRDPIANDPTVDTPASDISAAVTGAASSIGVSSNVLLLALAGLAAWAVLS